MKRNSYQRGAINGSIIAIVALVLLVLFFGGFSIWAYMQYSEQKTDVDGKVTAAVAEAKRTQADIDEAKFLEREKQPLRQFKGPEDYGAVTFDYPKTWSAYQATDLRSGGGVTYYGYLNPIYVPPTTPKDAKFAVRIKIEQKVYEKAAEEYKKQLDKGDLQSSAWSDNKNGLTGTMLKGNFTPDIRGTAVLIKMRDRTLTVQTDSDVFLDDYKVVLQTLNFNQ